jgi:transcriptional regulator with XRE-family HTH domain
MAAASRPLMLSSAHDSADMATSQFNPDRLEALRILNRMSKTQFLRKIGITRQGYDGLLNGTIKPNVSTLERIAARFNIECAYFFIRGVQQNTKHG